MECIHVKAVNKVYHKKAILDDINLSVHKSEIFGLLGPSGAGKTTLVKIIAGIDHPSTGAVSVLGVEMPKLDVMSKIGYMAQSDALYNELTAIENLQFFASIYGLKGKRKKQRIENVLELVNLTDYMKKSVNKFSGGMKRRLSLATSLIHEPEILILDEPTIGIDPVLRKSIWTEFENLSKNGTTIIVTTHAMDEAEKCHRLGMIRDGQLIATGSPDKLKNDTSSTTLEAAFLAYGGVEHAHKSNRH